MLKLEARRGFLEMYLKVQVDISRRHIMPSDSAGERRRNLVPARRKSVIRTHGRAPENPLIILGQWASGPNSATWHGAPCTMYGRDTDSERDKIRSRNAIWSL